MRNISDLIDELKRRRVFRVLIAYAVTAFVIIQLVDIIFPALHLPEWTLTFVIVLLGIGFPVVFGLAWAFDITDKGIVRTEVKQQSSPESAERIPPTRLLTKTRITLIAFVVIVFIGFAFFKYFRFSSNARWARQVAIPQIYKSVDDGNWEAAWNLAQKAEQIIPEDSLLTRIWSSFSRNVSITSEPSGANAFRKEYSALDEGWEYLGKTPLIDIRFPWGYSKLKLEKEEYTTINVAAFSSQVSSLRFQLHKLDEIEEKMIFVPGGKFTLNLPGLDFLDSVKVNDFFIDKFEVTNKEFKEFVKNEGYTNKEYWKIPFIKDGQSLPWDEAIAEFKDKTGWLGPAGWEVGDYPDGEDNYPVTGISWYEAAAFADYVRKSLPTIYHWSRAAGTYAANYVVPFSNFNGEKPSPVNINQGMSSFGAFNMAGNVREWCWNECDVDNRYILGGAWNDEPYAFNDAYSLPAFDRTMGNGFRCVQYAEDAQNLAVIGRPISRLFRDYYQEKPVEDEIFEIYRNMYKYDRTELNAIVEYSDHEHEDWFKEKITFDAAYGSERVIAYLMLPKNYEPPYATIIVFPGSETIYTESSEMISNAYAAGGDYIIKSGRALMLPIYKSTCERGDELKSDYASETKFYRDHVIMWSQDLGRSIDYLETRSDIDVDRIGYFGISWGAAMGAIMLAAEDRLKMGILYIAGMGFEPAFPEVDPINFITRINVPVLMLNGKYDRFFPLETSQRPMYDLLGTPEEHKRHVIYETGHNVPKLQLVKESLEWMDQYFGPVQ